MTKRQMGYVAPLAEPLRRRLAVTVSFFVLAAFCAGGCGTTDAESTPTASVSQDAPAPRVAGSCLVRLGYFDLQGSPWSPTKPCLALVIGDDTDADTPETLALVDVEGWRVRPISTAPGFLVLPVWRPDGRRLAAVARLEEYEGPLERHQLRLLDPTAGIVTDAIDLQGRLCAGFPTEALWHDERRLLVRMHRGTEAEELWLVDVRDRTFKRLTSSWGYFTTTGELIATEQWAPGGTRVVTVDPSGRVREFDRRRPALQFLNDARGDDLLLTVVPTPTSDTPALAVWNDARPIASGDPSGRVLCGRWPRYLRRSAGWGAWNHDASLVAALELEMWNEGAPRVRLVVLESDSGGVLLQAPVGEGPERAEEWYWKHHDDWYRSHRPRWSPVDNRLVFFDSSGDLWLLDVDSAVMTRLLEEVAPLPNALPPREVRAEWSSDGRFLGVFYPIKLAGREGTLPRLVVLEVPPR